MNQVGETNVPAARRSRAKILLVDDRADKLMALQSLLESIDAEVTTASSGREALRLLLKESFVLILLDVSMPGMDGFETASLIRQRPRTEHVPIIFITSINTNETHVTRGYSLGAVDYVFTPIVSEVLRAKVSVFIELFQKNEEIRERSESLAIEAARRAESVETRLRRLLNRLNVGVFRASLDGTLKEVNPALLRILGVNSIDQIPASHISVICGRGTSDEGGIESSSSAEDIQLPNALGHTIWLSLTRIVNQSEGGEPYIEGIVEDITIRKMGESELKQLNETLERKVIERSEALKVSQENLFRAERLASLGTLAAGIAHEINNPLNSILMSAEYALRKPAIEQCTRTLKTIAEETRRCGKIIRGVLQFAKNERTAKAPHDLNEVIARSLDIAKTYITTPFSIKLELFDQDLAVMLNPTEIEQVVVNLIQNASEASPEGAEIIVRTKRNEEFAQINFIDKGPGIKDEILGKIFDPFFSTRRTSGGTGLGLSVVHGIVTSHGGRLRAENLPGKGALFVIEFPLLPNDSRSTEYDELNHDSVPRKASREQPCKES